MYTIFLEISSILNQEAKKIYSEELMNCSFSRCWVGHTVWAAEGRNQASNGRQLVNQKVFQKCLKSVTKNDLKKCPQKCEPKKVLQKNLPKNIVYGSMTMKLVFWALQTYVVGIVLEGFFAFTISLFSTLMADYDHFLHSNTVFNWFGPGESCLPETTCKYGSFQVFHDRHFPLLII